jgi:environmental stress-induced protein Ves
MSGTLPFSEYPGIDRTLFVIGGDSLRIRSPIRDTVLTSVGSGLEFDGSEKIVGTVVGSGEMIDFNVLSRQDNVLHKATRSRVSQAGIIRPVQDLTIVFVQSGSAEVKYAGATASLAAGDTAMVGRIDETDIRVAGDNAVCIITDIERVGLRNPL